MRRVRVPRALWCTAAIVVALACAACGSSKSSAGSQSAATPTSTSGSASGGASASAAVLKLEKSPIGIAISTPLPRKPPTGKHIVFLSCSQPTCPPFALGLQPAAKALGWTVSTISYQPTPEAEVAALETAIREKPSGIFVTGLARAVIQSALKQAQAAHIPVVDGYTLNTVQSPIIANIANGPSLNFAPMAVAAWVASDTKCKGDVADFTIKSYPILAHDTAVFESTLKHLCPSVTIKQINAQATDVGTKIPGYVTTALQADPNIKVASFAFGSMTLGVPAAMKSAGVSAQLVGYGADAPTNVQSVKLGAESAETGFGLPYGGWRVIDAFARHFEGVSTSVDTTAPNPGELYVKTNSNGPISWTNLGEASPASIAIQFKKLWHVS